MKPTPETTSDARRRLPGRLARALSLGRSLAELCAERTRYRSRLEPPTAIYPQMRFSTIERRATPCR